MADNIGDPFSSLHSLEEDFYQSGYDLGVADGSHAGRIEGRVFGLQTGFEKFVGVGKLAARSNVWVGRLKCGSVARENTQDKTKRPDDFISSNLRTVVPESREKHIQHKTPIEPLPVNLRLEKHIHTTWALVEPATFSTQNNEEAVADFDDRFKRATAKAKVIEKIIGEPTMEDPKNMQDSSASKKGDMRVSKEQRAEKNIEDFGAAIRP